MPLELKQEVFHYPAAGGRNLHLGLGLVGLALENINSLYIHCASVHHLSLNALLPDDNLSKIKKEREKLAGHLKAEFGALKYADEDNLAEYR